ncbi:hypothetical protein Slin14017_G105400 [Septoria linicola]|nr:hypothetical protein Slin14017_G105400 [Septoria linicola]
MVGQDPISSFLDTYESGDLPSIPERQAIHCCCGDQACAYLQHNEKALSGLERDVRTAAQIGKALLTRHEQYILDSEKERKAMAAQIESLEVEKQALERRNANAIEENRTLLDQLESLNTVVAESDTQVTNLQATLRSTQQELSKLSYLQSRTEKLEQQLADFEREQASWQFTLEQKDESEKSALRRWQEAQRTLSGLQDQMERIEKEAQEEKERHVEVLGRMERQHVVERELDSAAGRLKGAAAVKTAGTRTNVVSHFVKDILQDNANLQMGIVELRDMLQSSNEEVETLRKQLDIHQPIVGETDVAQATSSPVRPHLKEEMRRATSHELHVHHHYHAPNTPKTSIVRRPKKKRYGSLTPSHFTPPTSGMSTPRRSFSTPSNTAAILSQTAASLPGQQAAHSKRWSYMSDQSYMSAQSAQSFSGPSSPQSANRASSMFDRVFSDVGQDSSRPTTPDTEEPGSPMFAPVNSKRISSVPMHSQRPSISSHRGRPSLDSILDISSENLREIDNQQSAPAAAIPEEEELEWENTDSPPGEDESDAMSPLSEAITQALARPRNLRRATSHESILSCRGMDIHTLKSRPSQLLTPYGGRSFTPQAVMSDATAQVAGSMSRPMDSSHRLLSGMAPATLYRQPSSNKPGLGSRVGGWMLGKWGASPTPTVTVTDSSVSAPPPKMNRTVSVASGSTGKSADDPEATPKKPKLRPPGINQMGPIPGFGPEVRIQHPPIMKSLDQTALRKVLEN